MQGPSKVLIGAKQGITRPTFGRVFKFRDLIFSTNDLILFMNNPKNAQILHPCRKFAIFNRSSPPLDPPKHAWAN